MWKRCVFSSAATLAFAFVACTDGPVAIDTDVEPAFAKGGGGIIHSASGSAHFPHPVQQVLDANRVISFNARVHADGTVTGQAQLNIMAVGFGSENPAITNYFQAEVLCLSVDGNRAWIGATIKTSSVPANIGQEVGWAVEDNGQGRSADPDRISTTQFPTQPPGFALAFCGAKTRVANIEVEGGNLQVR